MAKKSITSDVVIADFWNGHNPSDATLEAVIRDWKADGGDFFGLNEMWTKRKSLQRMAKNHGLYLFQEPAGRRTGLIEEAGSTAVLLNKATVKVSAHRIVAHKLRWLVYSSRMWHTGRRDQVVRFKLRGSRRTFVGRVFHFPTNGFYGGNKAAFGEQLRSVGDYFRGTRKRVTKFAGGDGNDDLDFFRKWASTFSGEIAGHRIDLVIVVNGEVRSRTLSKSGSDHHRIRTWVRAA